jgi:type II secretory pathway predicted ATPase ExeA
MHKDSDKRQGPTGFVRYQSQQKALQFIQDCMVDPRGVALLYGRRSSGKSVTIDQFVRKASASVAVLDGARLKTGDFLSKMLVQFGYDVELNSSEEMMNMLCVFAVQQTKTHEAPILVLENINDMFPSGLAALCNRAIGVAELGPMSAPEAVQFIYAKLRSEGVSRPDDVFSVEVCERLHAISGGFPGDLEKLAIKIMQAAKQLPVRLQDIARPDSDTGESIPRLIITSNGETLQEIQLTEKRALVGRSELSDIVIADQFVSKQHLLLIRDQNAIVLVDLKSRNGTYVNSRRVESKVLLNDDIVSLGDHRMKMVYPAGHTSEYAGDAFVADTARMKNIADARRSRERSVPTLVPFVSRKK